MKKPQKTSNQFGNRRSTRFSDARLEHSESSDEQEPINKIKKESSQKEDLMIVKRDIDFCGLPISKQQKRSGIEEIIPGQDLLKSSFIIPKILSGIIYKKESEKDSPEIDISEFMFEVDKNKVNSAKVRYRGVDRLIVNVLNNAVFENKKMEPRVYYCQDDDEEDIMIQNKKRIDQITKTIYKKYQNIATEQNGRGRKKTLSLKKKLNNKAKQQQAPFSIEQVKNFNNFLVNTNSKVLNILKSVEVEGTVGFEAGYKCDRQASLCDETNFVIALLQSQLDRLKVNNLFQLNKMAESVKQQIVHEDFNQFQLSEKLWSKVNLTAKKLSEQPNSIQQTSLDLLQSEGIFNQNQSQMSRAIAYYKTMINQQKKDYKNKVKLMPPPSNPKLEYYLQQVNRLKQQDHGDKFYCGEELGWQKDPFQAVQKRYKGDGIIINIGGQKQAKKKDYQSKLQNSNNK